MNGKPLTVAVVGATGVVGRTMIQVLDEREFPVGELRLLASGRSAGRTVSVGGRTHRDRGGRPGRLRRRRHRAVHRRRRHLARARAAAAARGRHGHRQLVGVADGPERSRSSSPRSIRTTSRATKASSPTRTARRCSSRRCSWPCATASAWSAWSSTRTSPSPARAPTRIAELEGQIRAHVDGRGRSQPRVYPHPIAFNALPEIDVFLAQRLHQGGVEGRQREPQDPGPAGPAHLVHGRPHPGLRQPLRGGPRRDARSDDAGTGARAVRGRPGRHRPGRSGRRTTTRWPPTATGRDEIFVGRVRQDVSIPDDRGIAFWVVSDNLRKGAATNAVEIAEVLVERGLGQHASARGARPYRVGEPLAEAMA